MIESILFRCVLEAVSDVLHLTVCDDTNESFVSSMMKHSFFFISSISVCNQIDYDTVLNLQRTKIPHNAPVQRLKITAFVVPVAVFRYIPRVMLLSGLQAPYINDLNRPPNEKSKNHGPLSNPVNSGPI